MPIPSGSPDPFDSLAARSRDLHGHRYVLPVATWVLRSESQVVGVREVMVGLGGRADRTRVIEALAKLAEFGALLELPREPRRNAPRFFERIESPYWGLARAYLAELEAPSTSSDDPPGPVDAARGKSH
jgi:hypothetical protein